MGKKSKNPSKKGKRDANVAHSSIQELQAGINSMSMNDAVAAVRMATNSINEMKRVQKKAADELKQARADVERSKLERSNNDLYADVNFWDKRYKDETSSSSAVEAPQIYEWYLNFEELKPLLLSDITQAQQQIPLVGEVLVAGCGNSSMCEDLFHAGVKASICGMDYVQSVVDTMNQRLDTAALRNLKTGGVRYICADGTNMPAEMGDSCCAVIDKGTLDAITSGGVAIKEGEQNRKEDGIKTGSGTDEAVAYMKEMWRILQPNGVFVVVSTMPPHLFHLVGSSIVPALANEQESSEPMRQGHGYRIHSFTTEEGGAVYYYSLVKPSAERQPASAPVPPLPTTSEYERLMAEAQAALQELRRAQGEVERQAATASALTKDLQETEEKADRISRELDSDLSSSVVSNIVNEARAEAASSGARIPAEVGRTSTEMTSLKEDVSSLEKIYLDSKKSLHLNSKEGFRSSVDASVPLALPTFPSVADPVPEVSLTLLSSSVLQTDGFVEVEFSITGGEWDEDDFISIHSFTGSAEEREKSQFDVFEYTSQPKASFDSAKSAEVLVGVCRLSLPSFGGPFQACYRRTFTAIADKTQADVAPGEELKENDAVITRSYRELVVSEMFQVSFQVQQRWKAEGSNVACRNLQRSREFMRLLSDSSFSVSKEFDNLTYFVEDLQSISVITLTIKVNPLSNIQETINPFVGFSRVSVWTSGGNGLKKDQICEEIISMEVDWCGQLNYLHIELPVFPAGYVLLMGQTSGSVLTQQDNGVNSAVVIRIPYDVRTVSQECNAESAVKEISACIGGLECSFCGNSLTVKGEIKNENLLPSGKFDHMMHEFLCSENPVMPLSMSDMETDSGSILVGNIYLSVNSQDIIGRHQTGHTPAVILACKRNPSVIDAVNSEVNSSIGSASGSGSGSGGKRHGQQAFIDTSTCAATCARCGVTVGDGQIVDQDEEDETAPTSEGALSKGDFDLADLSNVRFVRHRVKWRGDEYSDLNSERGMTGASGLLRRDMVTEQLVAHLLIAASNLFGSSCFELFVPDAPSMKIQIRVMSRPRDDVASRVPGATGAGSTNGYSVYHPAARAPNGKCGDLAFFSASSSDRSSRSLMGAIKISYSFFSAEAVPSVSGKGVSFRRISIEFADFEELSLSLYQRELWTAPSFRKHEKIGYLLL